MSTIQKFEFEFSALTSLSKHKNPWLILARLPPDCTFLCNLGRSGQNKSWVFVCVEREDVILFFKFWTVWWDKNCHTKYKSDAIDVSVFIKWYGERKKLFSTHVFTTRKFIIQKNIPFKIIYYFLGKGQANLFLYFALLKDSTKKSMKADQIFFCTYFCWIVFAICNEHIGGGVLIKLWPSTALEKFRSKKCFVRLRSK